MDIDFWDELIAGLDVAELDWLSMRIRRRRASLHPEITIRKTVIRKSGD